MYTLSTPAWLHKLYVDAIWDMPLSQPPAVYLTFDDGPHKTITPFVLDLLQHYDARASFFCIGKNVMAHPDIYRRILDEGHTIGNHTHNHLNGWKTDTKDYVENVMLAKQFIDSSYFRPPYGKIKPMQAKQLKALGYHIVMWSLLSADFDTGITPERCLENVVFNIKPGDIVVFHDSEKAYDRMSYALPRVLEHCKEQKWQMPALTVS
jgi:peptidoglycan/xylan/chitin deacetylase (PgdA/CDA1 family)